MFDVDTKARREPLPMTSMSGTLYNGLQEFREQIIVSFNYRHIEGRVEEKRVYSYSKYYQSCILCACLFLHCYLSIIYKRTFSYKTKPARRAKHRFEVKA